MNIRHRDTKMLRATIVNIGYWAVARGFKMPRSRLAASFDQQSKLIDIVRRLNINVFLDVGANRGFYSKHLRMSGYDGKIVSFEPLPEDHKKIAALAADDPKWSSYNLALGPKSGTMDFHVNLCGDTAGDTQTVLSSLLTIKRPIESHTIPVEVRRLDEVLPEIILDIASPRIFLKMDTQGFDAQVIKGASGYMNYILGLQSEISVIPNYEGMPHYTESLSFYEGFGFNLLDLFVVSRTADGCIVEYDCVMARPEALLSA